jgi:lipopolysaccharide/colanic/teichoic acid biosynthesis glycosyltransferase
MRKATASSTFYQRRGKRLLDLALALPLLLLLAPLMAVVALMVRWRLGKPVFFRQPRPGRRTVPFTLIKFRTMRETRDAQGRATSDAVPDAERLTAFGRWLRTTSLDEMPELFNIVRGEMSLVGPRPLLMHYLSRYTAEQLRRHEVRPGLTGWAQVHGRNALSWEEKFRLDLWYVDHLSLRLDLFILWRTVAAVLRREGIQQPGSATSEEFMGEEFMGSNQGG